MHVVSLCGSLAVSCREGDKWDGVLGHPPNLYIEVGIQCNIYWKITMGGGSGDLQSKSIIELSPGHPHVSAQYCSLAVCYFFTVRFFFVATCE